MIRFSKMIMIGVAAAALIHCAKSGKETEQPEVSGAQVWVTNPGQTALLWQTNAETSTETNDNLPTIVIDSTRKYQSVEGFGFTLTGGSALLISKLPGQQRAALLQELFGKGAGDISVSYLRVSIGASDLSEKVFTYDDLPAGQTDPELAQFSLSNDTLYVIPLLKEILAINPDIKIMGSPWTPPVWMKSNNNSMGGNLLPQFYGVYAKYFVRYIQAMKAQGISISAVTPQNEPQHGGNNPSLVMSAAEQADFIKNHLGPAFQAAGISTKIIVWDHNCDNPGYPMAILNDPAAKAFVAGSAFHLYNGDISALSQVHDAHPDRDLYFTEQWTGSTGTFSGDLKWHVKNVMIGSMRNWSKIALEWNLANDAQFNPHTPGGCTQCKGALTIDGNTITKNVSYYIVGQMSKFVPPGSVRIESNIAGLLTNAAFRTPDGKVVVVVLNESEKTEKFNIKLGQRVVSTSLSAGSVGTFVL